ncbi:MAG: four helix bundle protein [Candidatus Moranbacteria bacterium]|nr:four helix bundle protein [Candidatus Moranbacteria bacterium]
MSDIKKQYDLEDRTTEFAKRVIRLCYALPKNSMNNRLVGQIVGSAGSVGANYREANDSLGKKDFIHRLKISRKETKETIHWLELIGEANRELESRMDDIKKEAIELRNILSSIIMKAENKNNK